MALVSAAAGPFDFQPRAGYATAPLPRPLPGAAGLTGAFTFSLFLSLAHVGLYGPARASAQPPPGRLTAAGPAYGGWG